MYLIIYKMLLKMCSKPLKMLTKWLDINVNYVKISYQKYIVSAILFGWNIYCIAGRFVYYVWQKNNTGC